MAGEPPHAALGHGPVALAVLALLPTLPRAFPRLRLAPVAVVVRLLRTLHERCDARACVWDGLSVPSYDVDDPQARLIAGTEGDLATPFFSPDGAEVGYYDFADHQLKHISVNGGAPAVICPATNPYGVSWETDGTILFGQPEGILRVPATGGTPKVVIAADEGKRLYGPQLLPDGDSVLFVEAAPAAWNEGQIVVASMRTGVRTALGLPGRDVHYLPTGHLIYAVEGSLFAVAFDVDQLAPLGDAASIVQGVATAGVWNAPAFFAVSDAGTLVFVPGAIADSRRLVWVDRNGNEAPLAAEPRAYARPRLSPEGTRVAVSLTGAGADILVLDLLRGVAQNLTTSDSIELYSLWTRKGDRVVFSSNRDGVTRLYAISAEGSGDVEALTEGKEGWAQYPQSLAPDGSWLVFKEGPAAGGGYDLRKVSLERDRVIEDLVVTEFNEQNAELSPDGRWLAYESNRTGQFEVYLSPFPDVDSRRELVSRGGGAWPVWAPHGGELFYIGGTARPEARMMAVSVETDPVLKLGSPVGLFDAADYHLSFDVHPDGRFLMVKAAPPSAEGPLVIEVVLNWFEELKARVPTGR